MNQGVAYYFAHYKGEEDGRAPAPFPLIGTYDRQMMQGTCHGIRVGGNRLKSANSGTFSIVRRRSGQLTKGAPWMAQLVDPDSKDVICQAILIEDFHAVTHKKCFEDAKQRWSQKLYFPAQLIVNPTLHCVWLFASVSHTFRTELGPDFGDPFIRSF